MKYWTARSTIWMASNTTTPAAINTTPDVLIYGCVNNFNTIACIRSSLLAFLAVLTAVLCVAKVIRLHHARHQNWHQYFIFYCASLECTLAGVHWLANLYVQMDFILQWLKLSQFLVMCHFYWLLATRALRREVWTRRFLIPFLVLACTYFTCVAALGIIEVQDTTSECFQPYWLMMSSAEFLIVQLFCVAGFYITRRLNEISTLDSVRRAQKRDLWCIVVVFELSALIGVLYDLTLKIIGDENTDCSDIFKHTQELFSVIFFTFMVAKLLLPIWVMLFVFQPTPQVTPDNDDLIPALADDGNSAFSNTDEQYRQLYHPSENYRTLSYDTPTSRSPVSSYAPASPVGTINATGPGAAPTTNGTTVNAYKPPSNANLGTIREEGNGSSLKQTPSMKASSPATYVPRPTAQNNKYTSNKNTNQGARMVGRQSGKDKTDAGIVNKGSDVINENVAKNAAKTGLPDTGDILKSGANEVQKSGTGSSNNTTRNRNLSNQSIISNQSQGEESGNEADGNKRRQTKPKFTISGGNSEDSDPSNSPPPTRGKFYL